MGWPLALNRRESLLAAVALVAAPSWLNALYNAPLYRLGAGWLWGADLLQYVALPLLAAAFLLRPAGVGLEAVGLQASRHERGYDIPLVLAAAVVVFAWTLPAFRVAPRLVHGDEALVLRAMPAALLPRMLVAVYMAASAALVEEVVFRALPWLYLREIASIPARVPCYLVASTVLFAACHSEQGPAGVLTAAWFGLVAAIVYLRTRRLWPSVLAHFALDIVFFA